MPGRRFGRMRKIPKYDAGATAWAYNGTSSISTIADNALFDLPSGDWSIGGWCRIDAAPTAVYGCPIAWGGLGGNNSFQMYIRGVGSSDPGKITLNLMDNAGTGTGAAKTTSTIGLNRAWQHLLVCYDQSASALKFYADNVVVLSATLSLVAIQCTTSLWLGSSDANWAMQGLLRDWAKWDRLLTSTERAALAAGAKAAQQNSPSGPAWNVIMNKSEAATVGAFDPDGAGTLSCTNTNVTGADL